MTKTLRVPAIEVRQGKRTLYTLAIDGKTIADVATVSRIKRSDDGTLAGYQRPEVLSHISEIKNYIESAAPMIPNAVVVAFDSRVAFVPSKGPQTDYSRVGELVIPIDPSWAPEERPGFVVDGQQRLAAVREADVASFPICVSAFITDDIGEQTEQFILVNSTKPLPKGLIYELLPGTDTALPTLLARRRLPAAILTRLNRDEQSPLKELIQTATNPASRRGDRHIGVIKDNSILKMLEHSLSDGTLYRIRQGMGEEVDLEPMLGVLFSFWSAVSEVFDDDWGLPPKRSRLLHGAGVVCLGFLMDAIADRYRSKGLPTKAQFVRDLTPLAQICAWSTGHWEFGAGQQRKWNEIQNTSKDIQLLSNYLLVQYKGLVWNRSTSRERQLNFT
jgi:DGQHR domain-containing protein